MLLAISRTVVTAATAECVWALLCDVPELAKCLPNISRLEVTETGRRYQAVVSERLGPFRLEVPIQVEITTSEPSRRLVASLSGDERRGQARVSGTLAGRIEETDGATSLILDLELEVIGKLAALGAAPMRRRADEILSEFVACAQQRLAETAGSV